MSIGCSMLFNVWITENSKSPALMKEGKFAGQSDPVDIRGSYTLMDIEKAFGVPYEAEETTVLPAPALSLLKQKGKISEEQWEELQSRRVNLENFFPVDSVFSAVHEETPLVQEIKGNSTFGELYDWGLTKEIVEKVLGHSVGADGGSVRDFCLDHEIEFSAVKAELQSLLTQ